MQWALKAFNDWTESCIWHVWRFCKLLNILYVLCLLGVYTVYAWRILDPHPLISALSFASGSYLRVQVLCLPYTPRSYGIYITYMSSFPLIKRGAHIDIMGHAYNCDTKAKSWANNKNGQNHEGTERKPSDNIVGFFLTKAYCSITHENNYINLIFKAWNHINNSVMREHFKW